jgi:phosphatidylinositol glycan class W
MGLAAFIESPSRRGLIGQNKEGLISLPGYLAIYLLGLAAGEHVQRAASPPKRKTGVTETEEEHLRRHHEQQRTQLAMELFGYGLGWWIALAAFRGAGSEVSRRMVS